MANYKKPIKKKFAQNLPHNPRRQSRKSMYNDPILDSKKGGSKVQKNTTKKPDLQSSDQFWLYGNHAVEAALINPNRKKIAMYGRLNAIFLNCKASKIVCN